MDHRQSTDSVTPLVARLQSLLLSAEDVQDLLQEVVQRTAAVFGPSGAAAITVRQEEQYRTIAASDDRAVTLDKVQYESGSGPCLHALRAGVEVDVEDMASEHRWPAYAERARGLGATCSLSLPFGGKGSTVGAMSVYGFEAPAMFTGGRRHAVEVLAARAEGSLRLVLSRLQAARTQRELEEALSSRAGIDQAMGVIMGQQRCTAQEAFDLLRQASQRENRKLRDVAEDLVVRVTGHPPQPGRPFV